jgi:hypothetical protein
MVHIQAHPALLGAALAVAANTNTNHPLHDPIPSPINKTPETQSILNLSTAPSSVNALGADGLAHVLRSPDQAPETVTVPTVHQRQMPTPVKIDTAVETEVYDYTQYKGPGKIPKFGGGCGGCRNGAGSTLSTSRTLKGVGLGVMVVVVGVMGFI